LLSAGVAGVLACELAILYADLPYSDVLYLVVAVLVFYALRGMRWITGWRWMG